MTINLSYYRRQIKNLKAKVTANAELGNESEVKHLNREIANYERHIRQTEPTGVDKYLN